MQPSELNRRLRQETSRRHRAIVRAAIADRQTTHIIPTPERLRHGMLVEGPAIGGEVAARAGERMRRAQPPIERYLARGQISRRGAEAADMMRSDWELGIVGIRDRDRSIGCGGVVGYTDAQLDAATAYRKATAALGIRLGEVVLPIVIGTHDGAEINATTLSKRRGEKNEQGVMGILRLGLESLADHYGLA